ncbi:hypothetical protein P692DRAFT_20465833 [Suillus brevipes Sb2]|nr:hypothetical protein P692DRAFT_20465833 [Suillus brevipes Sb2]
MVKHNRPSSRKANRKVKSRPRRRLSLPPPRHLRHLVLLLLILPRQVQVRCHGSFHRGLIPCFFPTVHPLRIQIMLILQHVDAQIIRTFVISLVYLHCVCAYLVFTPSRSLWHKALNLISSGL